MRFFDGMVMIEDHRLLRLLCISLAARLPTADERAAIDGGGLALAAYNWSSNQRIMISDLFAQVRHHDTTRHPPQGLGRLRRKLTIFTVNVPKQKIAELGFATKKAFVEDQITQLTLPLTQKTT